MKVKCASCQAEIELSRNNIDDAIYYGRKYYHSSCFIPCCEKKLKSKRSKKEVWQYALDNYNEVIKASREHILERIIHDEMYNFMMEHYCVAVISKYIFEKLADIYSGNYKGMKKGRGIPPEHLIDMWTRQMNHLNQIAFENKRKGKEIVGEDRIAYDLAVLVRKYDSYLKWREKQKILEAEKESEKIGNIVSKDLNLNIAHSKINNVEISSELDFGSEDDLSDLVDDIFG